MITRKEYLNDSNNLHTDYYSQFVTPEIKKMVLSYFGLERLKNNYGKSLGLKGYINLSKWDALAGGYKTKFCEEKVKTVGDFPSRAGAVCILKTAAQIVVEENKS
mgnify:CR=1 FL=1